MAQQFVIIHGIGRNDGEKESHRRLIEGVQERLPMGEFHVVKWNDLGFSSQRVQPEGDDRPFQPPQEELLAREPSPFLFDRLGLLHRLRRRDVDTEHPAWTVQTQYHRVELRLLGMLLDYAGDVEIYLRDAKQRSAIQDRLRTKLQAAQNRGPVTVISHSLGTLVAYDVIHQQMPPATVRTLVTLGSPLENLLYLTRGFGLITYNLTLDADLNWLNIYDIKDVIASKLISGDFARDERDDWFWRSRLSGREAEFIREGSDEVRPVEKFWDDRKLTGLRTNVGLNRESGGLTAHTDYWKHSRTHGAVARLISDLTIRLTQ